MSKSSPHYVQAFRMFVLLVLMGILIVPGRPASTQSEVAAHFGSGIAFLAPPGLSFDSRDEEGRFPDRLFPAILSPDAAFAAGLETTGSLEDGYRLTHLHLWDIGQIDLLGPITRPLPAFSAALHTQTSDSSTIGKLREALAFSPDGQVLALQTQTSIVLFTVPELRVLQTISFTISRGSSRRLAWSDDRDTAGGAV